jgi:hypothetical protein
MTKPIVDNDGSMIEPGLHDGLLYGIVTHPDKDELTLLCRDVEGTEFRIVVPEIVRLTVYEFMEGNIILDVSIHEGDNCPRESIRKAYGYDLTTGLEYLEMRMKEVRDGRWTLLEIDTSYGCELFAVSKAPADRITVEQVGRSGLP